ncbi:MAG: hypothetical protein U5S82_19930 [Gammaproteobacteria bacterium]|nr:hypothetical protein [Gammaproteobacteria bacterium]
MKNLEEDTITEKLRDNTLAGGPVESSVAYHAPFYHPDRAQDYRTA